MTKASIAKNRKRYSFKSTLVGADYVFTAADGELICAHLGVPYDLIRMAFGAYDDLLRALLNRHVEALMESRDESGNFVAIFHWQGTPHVTAPQPSANEALAMALLFVLHSPKSAVT